MGSFSRDYVAYGLCVRSPIPPPSPFDYEREEALTEREPDVTVRLGALPAALPNARGQCRSPAGQAQWEATTDAFLMNVPRVARYLVTEGRDILVKPHGSDSQVGRFLPETVWAALLRQRGIATFHASAAKVGAGAVLFLGRSGAGKSSCVAALLQRGHAMLADEGVGVVLDRRGRPLALPGTPRLSLKSDVLDALDWRERASKNRWAESGQCWAPVDRFHAAALPIRALYRLAFPRGDGIEIETLRPAATFTALLRNAFGEPRLYGSGQTFFRISAAMAKEVPGARLRRSGSPRRVDAIADRIEVHLRDGI